MIVALHGNIKSQPLKLNCVPLDGSQLEVFRLRTFRCNRCTYFFQRERERVFTPEKQYFVLILKTVPQSLGGKKKINFAFIVLSETRKEWLCNYLAERVVCVRACACVFCLQSLILRTGAPRGISARHAEINGRSGNFTMASTA